jgi:hypothetical protein
MWKLDMWKLDMWILPLWKLIFGNSLLTGSQRPARIKFQAMDRWLQTIGTHQMKHSHNPLLSNINCRSWRAQFPDLKMALVSNPLAMQVKSPRAGQKNTFPDIFPDIFPVFP